MANMIKFFKGLEASLPASGVNGALYITTDEGAIYLGTGTGMKRLGDFVQVDNVAALPEKAHESCLYYCVAENILAKWNGTEWKQINKQPTAEEMKTLLGLGSLAYKSEVAEADLNEALAKKINDASAANHGHENKTVLDGITAEKVAAWDASEQNAKDYADGLDEAMDTRVKVVEAAIGENGSVATQIKTAIEALDFTDTAVDGEYVSAVNEIDGKISVTRKALPDYTNTYDAKGAADTAFENAKAYADGLAANYDEKGAAAGVQTALEAEIAKKVDKVEGKSLIADSEIARLATLANYDDTQVKADIAKKADAETMTTELGKKVDKVDGYSLVSDTEIARLANVDNYDDTTVKADIAKKADATETTNALAGKVDKVEGKSLVDDAEITKLAGVSAGANKVEASETNGNIKIDGVETTVYELPSDLEVDTLATAEITLPNDAGFGTTITDDRLEIEAAVASTYVTPAKVQLDRYVEDDDTDYSTIVEATGINTPAITLNGTDLDTRLAAIEANFGDGEGTVEAQIAAAVAAEAEIARAAEKANADDIDALEGRMDTAEGKITALEGASATHAVKTEVEAALALKADKSVVDAMYTNAQIDGFIADVKKYADDNDADTKYGIVYDSDNKKIKLVEGGTDVEIDASAFIKDGMISNVTIGDDNDLVITFNTDAGKENIVLPLDQLVDIYTGVEGTRVKVTVNADKSISADLVAGSIGKDYLDVNVKASLALADSAIQAHQDISHLATTEALNGVDAKFANYTNTTDMNAKFDLKADKTQVATDIADAVKVETDRAVEVENGLAGRIKDLEDNKAGYATTDEVATAKSEAITEAGKLDAALKTALQGEIDADVKVVADDLAGYKTSNDAEVAKKANSADVYAKTETFTKDEVNAAIAAAVEAAHTWGEF